MTSSALKEYRSPPVGEVNLGVQFRRIPGMGAFTLAKFVEHLGRSGKLMVSEAPEQPPRFETEQIGSTHQISFGQQFPGICFNIMDQERTQLISIQADRFSFRWLRSTKADYVRYDAVKEQFLKTYGEFCSWLRDQKISEPLIEQSEVQYVNFVEDDDDPTKYFNFIDLSGFQEPEGLQFASSQRLTEKKEVGRLFLEAQTQQLIMQNETGDHVQKPVLKVFLTFRGRQSTSGLEGTISHFDRGREAIVRTFTNSLSEIGRSTWGEQDRS